MYKPKSKKAWLDYLYYEIGKQATNFRLCSTFLDKEKEVRFSKWIPYLDAQENPRFMAKCNQREILQNEIIFDLDEGDFKQLCKDLAAAHISFTAYQTKKNRARHIHTYWRGLAVLPKKEREEFRYKLLKKFGCDTSLTIEAHMIPIEFCPHWKTGDVKEPYLDYQEPIWNDVTQVKL